MTEPFALAPVVTERFELHPLQAQHADAMFVGLSQPDGYAFIPDTPPVSLAALTERYTHLARGGPADGSEVWLNWVIQAPASSALLGYLQATVQPAQQRALVAYFVFSAYRQQGVARETLAAVLAELQARFALQRIEAQIDTRNTASLALVESLGFVRTASVRNADHFKGSDSHEYHYTFWLAPG